MRLLNLILPTIFAVATRTVTATPIIFKRDGNIYSEIVLQPGGLVLDFPSPNGPAAEGTQLQLYPPNGGDNQYFKFVPTDQYGADNYYTIVHMQTGYCVDLLRGVTANGAGIGLFHCQGSDNQVWSLHPINGGYLIVSMMANRCLNDLGGARVSGDRIGLWDCSVDPQYFDNYVWNINDAAIGKFWSQLRMNGLSLDFPSFNGPAPAGTQLQLYSSNGGTAHQFRFVPTSDGYYNLINQETGYCMDALNNAVDNLSAVGLFNCNGQDNQKWYFDQQEYYFNSFGAHIKGKQSGRCLNDLGGHMNQGDKIGLYDCINGDPSFKWEINFNAVPNKSLKQSGNPIRNVEVIVLLWGNVNNAWNYPDFYQTLLGSNLFDVLSQYGIGRGTYKGYIQLPPNGGPALPSNPNDIPYYLYRLVGLGYLNPNPNTYYAIHFAPGSESGVFCNGDCGYHTYINLASIPNRSTNQLIYGAIPDLTGCGCGGNNDFEAQTITASHELMEALTNPLQGEFRDPSTNAEIGDLCNPQTYYITGSNGNSYAIQRAWSNMANACVE
ncbi:hypothetical protein HDU76_004122 [Blyttiomyces sp. JEL0837]|nr:hypothetical protein HDU76_004122 [Blyttiomyces sp. JEL0837]